MVVVSHSWSGGRHNKAVRASCRSPASCYLIPYQLWLHVGCHRLPHFHTRGSAAKACWAPLRHHTWHGMSAELNLLALFFFFFLIGFWWRWFAKLARCGYSCLAVPPPPRSSRWFGFHWSGQIAWGWREGWGPFQPSPCVTLQAVWPGRALNLQTGYEEALCSPPYLCRRMATLSL